MERGDGDPGVVDGGGVRIRPAGVERLDERVEHPAAAVPPPGHVEGDGQLAEARPVELGHRRHQLEQVGIALEPTVERVLERRSHPATAVAQQLLEEVVAGPEVVRDAGVGHADPAGDGAHLDGGDATVGQELGGGVEDQGASLLWVSAQARSGHGPRSYLDDPR